MARSTSQPTPEQQRLLDRIAAQRERLRARRRGVAQAAVDSADPLVTRLLTVARLHPLATALALGVVMLTGPGRLVRWIGVALPIALQLRRL